LLSVSIRDDLRIILLVQGFYIGGDRASISEKKVAFQGRKKKATASEAKLNLESSYVKIWDETYMFGNIKIEKIVDLVKKCRIEWSSHAVRRMLERGISREEVLNCLLSDEIIEEYPDDLPFPSCLILGYHSGKPLHNEKMRCVFCKGEMKEGEVNVPVDLKGCFILIKGGPCPCMLSMRRVFHLG
jgi:hypothetical protein